MEAATPRGLTNGSGALIEGRVECEKRRKRTWILARLLACSCAGWGVSGEGAGFCGWPVLRSQLPEQVGSLELFRRFSTATLCRIAGSCRLARDTRYNAEVKRAPIGNPS